MAQTTYKVVGGDTLSEIAERFDTTVDKLVELNNIKDPDFIVVGQVLKLSGTKDENINVETRPTINAFGLLTNTDRTVYASWSWNRSNTDHYQVRWQYKVAGIATWFQPNENETTKLQQSTYNAPDNATHVRFKVKAVSKTKNGSTTTYEWVGGWTTYQVWNFALNPPTTPPVPSVSIDKYTITAELNNIDLNAEEIIFQVHRDNYGTWKNITAKIKFKQASCSVNISAGTTCRVRCRSKRGTFYSGWSEYSDSVSTLPVSPSSIKKCEATSSTSIYLEWPAVSTATSYSVEYTTKQRYFDGSSETTTVSNIEQTHYEFTGLASGEEYFFRVRAKNADGAESEWSGIKSVVIGKKPIAPTTWSSSTTVITGEDLVLYWVHNAEDGSKQTFAEIELTVDGVTSPAITIRGTVTEGEGDEAVEKTNFYAINTSEYPEGTQIQWRVRTAGVTKDYGEWSVLRTIDIYAPPTLDVTVSYENSDTSGVVTSFPFTIFAVAGPNTQAPIGYHVSIIADMAYETVDEIGNAKSVIQGEAVYSRHFDITTPLDLTISAGDVDLENNIPYTLSIVVSMNSGLTAIDERPFEVAWVDNMHEPNAEIGIDEDTLAAYIRPYCVDAEDNLVEDILLSVYRREYDGSFTEIATGIDNLRVTTVTDPHPALDYARYRIVAITKSTGAVSYADIPGFEVGCKSVVIQWDEAWSSFDVDDAALIDDPVWSGSMLKLPYNIDVSDSHNVDVALIEYIGRKRPVSYYGTQLGESASWKMDIPKDDKETLYALRRLAVYMGDVYVREPSGSGYWAHISVSFSQKHLGLTIPVTIDVTRVEGGI